MKGNSRKKKSSDPVRRTYELVCCSNPREIRNIESFLHRIHREVHLDDGTMHRLLVACTEAVNNAVIHGNKSDPSRNVVIRCVVDRKLLTVRVKDEGEGFDPDTLPDPLDEKNLLKENGRGVFLIRSLMDSVKFRKLKSGSVTEMKVKLH